MLFRMLLLALCINLAMSRDYRNSHISSYSRQLIQRFVGFDHFAAEIPLFEPAGLHSRAFVDNDLRGRDKFALDLRHARKPSHQKHTFSAVASRLMPKSSIISPKKRKSNPPAKLRSKQRSYKSNSMDQSSPVVHKDRRVSILFEKQLNKHNSESSSMKSRAHNHMYPIVKLDANAEYSAGYVLFSQYSSFLCTGQLTSMTAVQIGVCLTQGSGSIYITSVVFQTSEVSVNFLYYDNSVDCSNATNAILSVELYNSNCEVNGAGGSTVSWIATEINDPGVVYTTGYQVTAFYDDVYCTTPAVETVYTIVNQCNNVLSYYELNTFSFALNGGGSSGYWIGSYAYPASTLGCKGSASTIISFQYISTSTAACSVDGESVYYAATIASIPGVSTSGYLTTTNYVLQTCQAGITNIIYNQYTGICSIVNNIGMSSNEATSLMQTVYVSNSSMSVIVSNTYPTNDCSGPIAVSISSLITNACQGGMTTSFTTTFQMPAIDGYLIS